jgi:hypothetical protein
MSLLRRMFLTRLFGESVIQGIFTVVGVFTFLAGILYLPTLGPTRMEAFIFMLLLAVFAILCATFGQLVVVAERLEGRVEKSAERDAAVERPRD